MSKRTVKQSRVQHHCTQQNRPSRVLHRRARGSRSVPARVGSEVPAGGQGQHQRSLCHLHAGEAFLFGSSFLPLNAASSHVVCDPTRTRKLLLSRRELDKLESLTARQGYTIVPLAPYWKACWVKVEIGLVKERARQAGKTPRHREWDREGPHHEEQAPRVDLCRRPHAATNKPAIDRPRPVDCHQRLAMTGFLRTIPFDNLGLILDSTRFHGNPRCMPRCGRPR